MNAFHHNLKLRNYIRSVQVAVQNAIEANRLENHELARSTVDAILKEISERLEQVR